ncbi:MAG: hypothetical protein WBV94_14415 [Blastocatellia bacterium]
MNQAKVKNFIEVASNVAVVVVALVVVISFIRGYISPSPAVRLQGGLQKGTQFPQVIGIDFSKSQRTLLVALDPNCESCVESFPFFKSLADKLYSKSNEAKMVVMFESSEETTKRYVRENQLKADAVFGTDFKAFNLSAIPAIILINNQGTIIDFWLGKPSNSIEEQIIRQL